MEPDAHWGRVCGATAVAALETGEAAEPAFVIGTATGDLYIEMRRQQVTFQDNTLHGAPVKAVAASPSGRVVVAARRNVLSVYARTSATSLENWRAREILLGASDDAITAVAVYEATMDGQTVVACGTAGGYVGVFACNNVYGGEAFYGAPPMRSFEERARARVQSMSAVRALVFVHGDGRAPPVLMAQSSHMALVEYAFQPHGDGCSGALSQMPCHGKWRDTGVGLDYMPNCIAPSASANTFVGVGEWGMARFVRTNTAMGPTWDVDLIKNAEDGGNAWQYRPCKMCTACPMTTRYVLAARPDLGAYVGAAQCGHIVRWRASTLGSSGKKPRRTVPAPGAAAIAATSDGTVLCMLTDGRTCGWDSEATTVPRGLAAAATAAAAAAAAAVRGSPRAAAWTLLTPASAIATLPDGRIVTAHSDGVRVALHTRPAEAAHFPSTTHIDALATNGRSRIITASACDSVVGGCSSMLSMWRESSNGIDGWRMEATRLTPQECGALTSLCPLANGDVACCFRSGHVAILYATLDDVLIKDEHIIYDVAETRSPVVKIVCDRDAGYVALRGDGTLWYAPRDTQTFVAGELVSGRPADGGRAVNVFKTGADQMLVFYDNRVVRRWRGVGATHKWAVDGTWEMRHTERGYSVVASAGVVYTAACSGVAGRGGVGVLATARPARSVWPASSAWYRLATTLVSSSSSAPMPEASLTAITAGAGGTLVALVGNTVVCRWHPDEDDDTIVEIAAPVVRAADWMRALGTPRRETTSSASDWLCTPPVCSAAAVGGGATPATAPRAGARAWGSWPPPPPPPPAAGGTAGRRDADVAALDAAVARVSLGGGSEAAPAPPAPAPAEPAHECVVCTEALTDEARRLLLPCAHARQCAACAPKLKTCPICRAPIQSVIRVFL